MALIRLKNFQSLTITALSFLVSVIGFVNHLLLARVFGIGADIDAFLYATSLPLFLSALLTSYFMYGAVPILMQSSNQSRSLSEMLVASCFLACPFFIVALFITLDAIYFSLFSFELIGTTARLVSIAWIIGGFQVISGALSAIFNAKRYFLIPILLQMLTPIGFAGGALLTVMDPDIIFPLIGMLFGVAISILVGIFVLWSFLVNIRQSTINDLIRLLRGNSGLYNTLIASSAFAAYSLIDAVLAPRYGPGTLSSLGYAQRIVIGFGNIAVIGVFSTSGPKFSDSLLKGGFDKFKKVVRHSIITVLGLSVSMGLFIWYNIELLITFIFGEKIHSDQLFPLLSLLSIMLCGMTPMLCSTILLRAVLCIKDSQIYIFMFGIGVPFLYSIFCLLLSPYGLLSFGYAYLISWIFGFCVLFARIFCGHHGLSKK